MELLQEHLDVNNRFFFLGYNSDKFSRIQVIFHDLRLVNRRNALSLCFLLNFVFI